MLALIEVFVAFPATTLSYYTRMLNDLRRHFKIHVAEPRFSHFLPPAGGGGVGVCGG